MSVTGDFAAFIAASLGIVLPAAVQRVTCRAFANWVGCALGAADDRSAGLAAFEAADVHDAGLGALRELMVVEADGQLAPSQARVRVDLKDGAPLESAIDHPSGSPQRPLTDAQLRAKFDELARRVVDERAAAALFDACMSLERLLDTAPLRQHWSA